MIPGPRNLITDIDGLRVGNAADAGLKSGVTVLTADAPFTAGVSIMGGAPGTRETDLLAPDKTVEQVDALVLSGGSAFGLAAADGVMAWARRRGAGFCRSAPSGWRDRARGDSWFRPVGRRRPWLGRKTPLSRAWAAPGLFRQRHARSPWGSVGRGTACHHADGLKGAWAKRVAAGSTAATVVGALGGGSMPLGSATVGRFRARISLGGPRFRTGARVSRAFGPARPFPPGIPQPMPRPHSQHHRWPSSHLIAGPRPRPGGSRLGHRPRIKMALGIGPLGCPSQHADGLATLVFCAAPEPGPLLPIGSAIR